VLAVRCTFCPPALRWVHAIMVTVTALLLQPRVGLAKSQAPVPHGANWASMGFKDITVICLPEDK